MKNDKDKETDASAPSAPATPRRRLDRRSFLGGSAAAAAGGLLAYSPPTVEAASAGAAALSPGPFDQMVNLIQAFPFSAAAQADINALRQIASVVATPGPQGGPDALTSDQLDQIWVHGWQPASEINPDRELRPLMNSVIFQKPDAPWAAVPGQQSLWLPPADSKAKADINDFLGAHPPEQLGFIIIIIIIIILVVDFPTSTG
jgi:hypothetical protein